MSPTPASPSTNADSAWCRGSRSILRLDNLERFVDPRLFPGAFVTV
jgi:hypothetical protein